MAENTEGSEHVGQWTHVVAASVPWPARKGLRCRVVTDEMDPRVYPRHGLGAKEVIVLIENDPLDRIHSTEWTCVLDRDDIEPADG